ncbi:MAG TPA: alpha-L-arabinofuranosidase C-terminal domain-containing protein, partial [Tepidisphaeraceae bacterium]
DINFAADGGLYPERIKNRSFEFADPVMGWNRIQRKGTATIQTTDPLNENNPHYLRLSIDQPGEGLDVENEGFRGIGVAQGATFTFSCFARRPDANAPALKIQILSPDGHILATADLAGFTNTWKKHSVEITATGGDSQARLRLLATGLGTLDLDMISLFPKDTFNNRPNGLRADLAQLLKDMHPAFMRFPGGCIIEGRTLDLRYRWKDTIGPLEARKLIINRWNNEFKHRPTPDYYQSYGLGFFEFFQLCEDIGAKPLPVLNCGMACQFNTGELCPLDKLEPYVQDALDLVEFANGGPDTTWGAKRAAMGHPAPFNLDLLGVGNEQWGPQYIERYKVFAAAIKAKYPNVKLISGAGPSPQGKDFEFAWRSLRELGADVVDEHYYNKPDWFGANVHRYDKYPRNGPKVFAGEFAAQSVAVVSPNNRNDLNCALAEAALMTGLERNADVVVMASYAPLFAHVDAWQWTPNLIWFDNLRSYGTPSYYVQKLFATNRGDRILPADFDDKADNLFASAARTDKGDVLLKVVNRRPTAARLSIHVEGAGQLTGDGECQVLASGDLKAENSLDEPTKISPISSPLSGLAPQFERDFPPYSLTVLRIHTRKP